MMFDQDEGIGRYAPVMASVLRIVVGLVFLDHGTSKILGFPLTPVAGHVELFTLPWFSGMIELVGGALVLVGLFTRVAAFVTAGEMAVAYFIAHAPRSPFPVVNGGDAAILFCWAFLFFAVAGGGPLSLDRLVFRRRSIPWLAGG